MEYSNEVWNMAPGYDQAPNSIDSGIVRNYCAATQLDQWETSWICGARFQAQKSYEVIELQNAVFGADSDRLIRVIGGHYGNSLSGMNNELHGWDLLDPSGNATGLNILDVVDMYTTAPYFGHEDRWTGVWTPDLTVAEGIAYLTSIVDAEMGPNNNTLRGDIGLIKNKTNIRGDQLRYVAYEGGEHMILDWGSTRNNFGEYAMELNADMGMMDFRYHWLDLFRQEAESELGRAELFVTFNGIAKSDWHSQTGFIESLAQDTSTAPKYLAMTKFLTDHPSDLNAGWTPGAGGWVADDLPSPAEACGEVGVSRFSVPANLNMRKVTLSVSTHSSSLPVIKLNGVAGKDLHLRIFQSDGRQVSEMRTGRVLSNDLTLANWRKTSLATGVYYVSVEDATTNLTEKMVVVR